MNESLIQKKLETVLNGDFSTRFNEEDADEEKRLLLKTINYVLDNVNEKETGVKNQRSVIENSPVPMLLFDSNFNIKDANPAFFRHSGYSKDYILGTNADIFRLSNIEGDSFMHVKEIRRPGTAKMQVELPSGIKIYERHLIPYLDEGGRAAGYFGIYFDITEVEASKKEIQDLRELTLFYGESLSDISSTLARISSGDIGFKIEKTSDAKKFPTASEYFTAVYSEIEKIQSEYSAISEISDVIAKVSVNDYTRKLTGNYSGSLKEIAESANNMVDHLLFVQETVDELADGDLSKLELYKKIKQRSDNDRLIPAFTKLMENLTEIVDEAETITNAAKRGNLSYKVNLEKFKGEYRIIVRSFVDAIKQILIPLNESRRMAELLAKGDYTVRFNENLHAEGDFAEFKDEMNAISIEGADIIKEIKSVAANVNSNTSEVSIGASEISKAVEQVALNSQKGAALTNKLLSEIKAVSEQITDFSAANEELAGSSQHVLGVALQIVKNGEEAKLLGGNTTKSMASVKEITGKSVVQIEELNLQMQEINNIVKMITEIANQINLLSLNAAIEAARAGEHGRGFAVVAGEVKNLAYEARGATSHIEEVIEKVKRSSINTSDAITLAHNEVNKSYSDVEKTIDALNKIINETNDVTASIGEITKTLESQAQIAINVVSAADAGTRLTEEVLTQSEELAALAEESSASTEEITSAIHEVSLLTKELENSTSTFKI